MSDSAEEMATPSVENTNETQKTKKKKPVDPNKKSKIKAVAGSSKKLKLNDMVELALRKLHKRSGTSLYAIKKHMSDNHNLDENYMKRVSSKITNYIIQALKNESLVQTKGKGASGSFRLAKLTAEKSKQGVDKDKKKILKKEGKSKQMKNKNSKGNVTVQEPKTKKTGKKDKNDKLKKARKSITVTATRKSLNIPKRNTKMPKVKPKKTASKKGKDKTDKAQPKKKVQPKSAKGKRQTNVEE